MTLIDVSHHNVDAGPINWDRVDSTVDGVYMKLTEGSGYVDPTWTGNYSGARATSLPCGAYHFADLGNPVTEANHFADQYLTKTWQLRPVLDIETNGATAGWISAFRAQFRQRVGSRPFRVYTGHNFLVSSLKPAGWIDPDTDIWAARYASTLGWDHPQLVLWQGDAHAHVPGVVGDVDTDQYKHGWTPAADLQGDLMATDFNSPDDSPDPGTYGHDLLNLRQQFVAGGVNQVPVITAALAAIQKAQVAQTALLTSLAKAVAVLQASQAAPLAGTYPATITIPPAKSAFVHDDIATPEGV